jgi:hypothetical protein
MVSNITTLEELKQAIAFLEAEQALKENQLKDQFLGAVESIKPVNIIKHTLKEIITSPYLVENVVGAGLGIASGYYSKRMVVRGSVNMFRKLFGTLLQFGVANLVVNQSHILKRISRLISNRFSGRRTGATDAQ